MPTSLAPQMLTVLITGASSGIGAALAHCFDAARHQMMGERTARRFRLGDKVRVRLARVDLETTRIDFSLVDTAAPAATNAAPQKKARKK